LPRLNRTSSHRTSSHRSPPLGRPRSVVALVAAGAVLLAGCADAGAPDAGTSPGGDPAAGTSAEPERLAEAPPTVRIEGDDLVLVEGERATTLASLDEGELVHAEVRPGTRPDGAVTVLALARTDGRYELRYVTRAGGAVTDLYWFPSRLQIDPGTAGVLDVPTVPVWAPDGSAVAWLEWTAAGTRLRTVGWLDHDAGTNPSDDQATYRVDELPVGSQLTAWEVAPSGTPVLVARDGDGATWRIRIEGGAAVVDA
jgi:hypothetical protein